MSETPSIDVRRADTRFHTDLGWLDSHHSFSFGHHFDPANTGHGLLVVSNDDTVTPARGFGAHPHRDMEIVSWVLDGALEHHDSEGNRGVITPGLIQRMSAGTGIVHAEMNASAEEPVHFLQMWVVPDRVGIPSSYEELDVRDRLAAGGLVTVASGQGVDGAISLHQRDAALLVGQLDPGEEVELPDVPYVHAYVARGAVDLAGERLVRGDAVRLTAAGKVSVVSRDESELVVWAMTSTR